MPMSDSHFDNLILPSVSIARISPEVSEQELFSHRQCYIGISLDNPVFRADSLNALLVWAVKNFDRSLVVVGDYLRRHNEFMLHGVDEMEAAKISIQAGDEFVGRTAELFKQLPAEKIELTRWEPLLSSDEYIRSRAVLDDLFASNGDFKAAIEKDALLFVGRQQKRKCNLAVSMDDAVAISCTYLLEEIAVFGALSEQGWNVELYPGPELSVLLDIAAGKFNAVPAGLKSRINVQLHIGHNRTGK